MAITKPNLTRIWAADAAGVNVVDPDVKTPGKFALGWGAEKPPYQFFNFMQKLFTQGLGYFDEQGIGFWNTDTDYQDLSLTKGSDGTLYLLKVGGDGTIDPVVDAGTNWTQLPTRAEVDAKAAISGQVFTGNVTAPNLSGTNTGDQDLSDKANQATTYTETEVNSLLNAKAAISGQVFTGNIVYYGAGGVNTNAAYGGSALFNNTTGGDNTANGRVSLLNNTTGNGNTASGRSSGLGITTGSGNSIFGASVTDLASDLENNLILASGGVIRYRYNGTETTIGGPLVITGAVSGTNLSGTNTGDQALNEIGVGQTWQNVTDSRVQNTSYTNSTGKPIMVSIILDTGAVDSGAITVDSVGIGAESGTGLSSNQFIVPNGSVYRVNNAGIFAWTELR